MSGVIARMKLDYFADDGSCQLKWTGHQEKRAICREYSMQALSLALKMVPVAIQIADDFKAGRFGRCGKRYNTVVQLNKAGGIRAMKGLGK